MKRCVWMLFFSIPALLGCWQVPGVERDITHVRGDDIPPAFDSTGARIDHTGNTRPYIIGKEDKLRINVRNHPEFDSDVHVDHNGEIEFDLLTDSERITVDGSSLEALQSQIAKRLRSYFKSEPIVRVKVLEAKSKKFYIFGAVGNQGERAMGLQEIRLREALLAGGVDKKEADFKRVYLIKPHRTRPCYVVINGEAVLMGKTEDNVLLEAGDVVYVPTTAISKFNDAYDFIIDKLRQYRLLDNNIQFVEDVLPNRTDGR